jgi:hypothetical protein
MKTVKEAIDTGDNPEFFHPSKKNLYKDKLEVEKMFPDLTPEEKRYIELVTSESYKKTVERLLHYTGKTKRQLQGNGLMTVVYQAMNQLTGMENQNKQALEKLAIDVVLNLPEFKMFKELVSSGQLKIDAKIAKPDLSNAVAEPPQEEPGLDQEEQQVVNFTKNISDASEGVLKRKFANMITQGNATNKLYLFQLASDALNNINPNFINLYGILSSVVQTSYYSLPVMSLAGMDLGNAAMGSEEVIPEDDVYTIKARGTFFPYLVHEIVKGLYDYLSMDITTQENLDTETLNDEFVDIMSGPQLYTNLTKHIPSKDIEYLPLVYKLLLKENINIIKEVLSGGGKAQSTISRLVQQAKQIMGEYSSSSEEGYTDTYNPEDSE